MTDFNYTKKFEITTPVEDHGMCDKKGGPGKYDGQGMGLPERTTGPNSVPEKFFEDVPGAGKFNG